jgi:hypothetical protein
MIVDVAIAVALVAAGATAGVAWSLSSAQRADGLFTRMLSVPPETISLSAKLTLSLLPDETGNSAGPLTPDSLLTIILTPDEGRQ